MTTSIFILGYGEYFLNALSTGPLAPILIFNNFFRE
jgi:hypothetical protein